MIVSIKKCLDSETAYIRIEPGLKAVICNAEKEISFLGQARYYILIEDYEVKGFFCTWK